MKFIIVTSFIVFAALLQVSLSKKDLGDNKLVAINGYRYYLSAHDEIAVADDAATICTDLGMALLSLETYDEYEAVSQYLIENVPTAVTYWTSGRYVNDEWVWTGSGQVFDNATWAPGQPDERDLTQAAVYINGYVDGLGDTKASTAYCFICE